jgi:hypothetical protein
MSPIKEEPPPTVFDKLSSNQAYKLLIKGETINHDYSKMMDKIVKKPKTSKRPKPTASFKSQERSETKIVRLYFK